MTAVIFIHFYFVHSFSMRHFAHVQVFFRDDSQNFLTEPLNRDKDVIFNDQYLTQNKLICFINELQRNLLNSLWSQLAWTTCSAKSTKMFTKMHLLTWMVTWSAQRCLRQNSSLSFSVKRKVWVTNWEKQFINLNVRGEFKNVRAFSSLTLKVLTKTADTNMA